MTSRTLPRAQGADVRANKSLCLGPTASQCKTMSTSCASSAIASHVSTKPWFLTFSEETRDVFVWKNGMRLQLHEGESAGGVRSVSVRNVKDRTITVSFAILVYHLCIVTTVSHALGISCVLSETNLAANLDLMFRFSFSLCFRDFLSLKLLCSNFQQYMYITDQYIYMYILRCGL